MKIEVKAEIDLTPSELVKIFIRMSPSEQMTFFEECHERGGVWDKHKYLIEKAYRPAEIK